MGGFGALHLGFKYPKLFAHVSAIAPAILRDIALEPAERVDNTFFGDAAYYNAVAPWTLLLANSPEIRSHLQVRLVAGMQDHRLVSAISELDAELTALDVPHSLHIFDGIDHEHLELIDAFGDDYFTLFPA